MDTLEKATNQPPLSPLMIATLLIAYAKQKAGIEYGQTDVRGSFTALITRGLIARRVSLKDTTEFIWQVTDEAIEILKSLGMEVPV